MDAIGAAVRLVAWIIFFLGAAILSPPVIIVWTRLDESQPFWPTFWRRYRYMLLESFLAG